MFAFNKAKVKMRHRGRVMTWRQEARSCKGDYPLLLHDYSQTRKWGETKDNKKKKKGAGPHYLRGAWFLATHRRSLAALDHFCPGDSLSPKECRKGHLETFPHFKMNGLGGKKTKQNKPPPIPPNLLPLDPKTKCEQSVVLLLLLLLNIIQSSSTSVDQLFDVTSPHEDVFSPPVCIAEKIERASICLK